MARIRTLKPEFWDSPSTATADLAVRLTFMAMWNWADDSGRGTANLKELEAFVFPNDVVTELPRRSSGNSAGVAGSWRNFAEICGEVAEVYGVVFYRVNNRPYYVIPSFKDHQSKDYRPKSRYPSVDEGEIYDVISGKEVSLVDDASPSSNSSAGMRGNSADSSGDSGIGTGEQGNRGTGEQGNSSSSSEVETSRPEYEELLDLLDSLIVANGSKKPSRSKKNVDAVRLMVERDNRSLSDIEGAIRWSQANDFWRGNILSMSKLREKFDQLRLAAQRDREKREGSQLTENQTRAVSLHQQYLQEEGEGFAEITVG